MQDPLFTLVPEQSLDLKTLFSPGAQVETDNAGTSQATPQPEAIENAVAAPESVQEAQDVMENAEMPSEAEPGSLLERIQKIEEEYNSRPIPIYGGVHKRLVTLAKKLSNDHLHQQATLVCDIVDGR